VVLVAATARGEAGRQRLWALVDHGLPPWRRRAGIALSHLAPDARRDELEGALLRALGEAPDDVDVADALGRIGSVGAVERLRAVGGAAAERAVAAIQARSVGEAGGVSVATERGGELAEAPGPGALSTPDDPAR
jgi:hypothetical protein